MSTTNKRYVEHLQLKGEATYISGIGSFTAKGINTKAGFTMWLTGVGVEGIKAGVHFLVPFGMINSLTFAQEKAVDVKVA